jgi:hypothetical protein
VVLSFASPFAYTRRASNQAGAVRTSGVVVGLSSFGAKPNDPAMNSRLPVQQAVEKLGSLGGGTLSIPAGDYYFYFPDLASDVDPRDPRNKTLLQQNKLEKGKLILVPPGAIVKGTLDQAGRPITRIHWNTTSIPLLSFVNADHAGVVDLSFIFDGVQPQFFPWTQEDFLEAAGYRSRWLGGPYELSTVIYAIGSSNLRFENLSFQSSKAPADNEHTFAFGIVSKGRSPVPQPDEKSITNLRFGVRIPGGGLSDCVSNNVFRSLRFEHNVMGILASGQCGAVFEDVEGSFRGSWYRSFDPAHETGSQITYIGPPGHLLYLTFQNAYDVERSADAPNGHMEFHSTTRNRDVTLRNIREGPETLSNVNSLGTLALKNMQGGRIAGVVSRHPAGLIQSMVDVHHVQLENLDWSSDRDICNEASPAAACGIPVITLEPAAANSGTRFNSAVQFKNVALRGLRRSVMFKISEESGSAPLSRNITVDGLSLETNPAFTRTPAVPQGVITVRSLQTHFTNVRFLGVLPSGATEDRQNYPGVIQSRSQDTTLEITIPAEWDRRSNAASKCVVADQVNNKCYLSFKSAN